MRWPTDEELDRAADVLATLAGIPGLEGGIAMFRGDLERVRWYEVTEDTDCLNGIRTHVPPASAYDSHNELLEACRFEIREGFWDRQDAVRKVLPVWFEMAKERPDAPGPGPSRLRQLVSYLEEDVERGEWQARLDAEWPPLSVVGGN